MFTKIRSHLHSSKGAFDLPSVLVASLISVILATTLIVSVIGITRLAFDNSAKAKIATIATAQKTFFASNDRYGSTEELTTQKLIPSDTEACVLMAGGNGSFTIASRSQSGTIYYASSASPETISVETGSNKYCLP